MPAEKRPGKRSPERPKASNQEPSESNQESSASLSTILMEIEHSKVLLGNVLAEVPLFLKVMPSFISDMHQSSDTSIHTSDLYKNSVTSIRISDLCENITKLIVCTNDYPILFTADFFYERLSQAFLPNHATINLLNKLKNYLDTRDYSAIPNADIIYSLITHFVLQPLEEMATREPEKVHELLRWEFHYQTTILTLVVKYGSEEQLKKILNIAYLVSSSFDKELPPKTNLPSFYFELLSNNTNRRNILCCAIRASKTRNLMVILDAISATANDYNVIGFFRNDDLNKSPLGIISTLPDTPNNNLIRKIFANFLKDHFFFPEDFKKTDMSVIKYAQTKYDTLERIRLKKTSKTKNEFIYTICNFPMQHRNYASETLLDLPTVRVGTYSSSDTTDGERKNNPAPPPPYSTANNTGGTNNIAPPPPYHGSIHNPEPRCKLNNIDHTYQWVCRQPPPRSVGVLLLQPLFNLMGPPPLYGDGIHQTTPRGVFSGSACASRRNVGTKLNDKAKPFIPIWFQEASILVASPAANPESSRQKLSRCSLQAFGESASDKKISLSNPGSVAPKVATQRPETGAGQTASVDTSNKRKGLPQPRSLAKGEAALQEPKPSEVSDVDINCPSTHTHIIALSNQRQLVAQISGSRALSKKPHNQAAIITAQRKQIPTARAGKILAETHASNATSPQGRR
jgi:hypothetical protein